MQRHPIVLIHGYSDDAGTFKAWERILEQRGYDVAMVRRMQLSVAHQRSHDQGHRRGIRSRAQNAGGAERGRAIRRDRALDRNAGDPAWLTAYDGRRDRLKHLIGLAPATFGSPLAHKGRSWLGALFKGNRHLGPDFHGSG